MNKQEKPTMVAVGDGIADDTDAIQAHMRGTHKVVTPEGVPIMEAGGTFKITRTIDLRDNAAKSPLDFGAVEDVVGG